MEKYLELAKEILNERYSAVGVRGIYADEQYEVGDECRESYEWDFENDCSTYFTTGEKAGGTCATHIDTQYFETDDEVTELAARIQSMVEQNEEYGADRQVIIAGYDGVNNDAALDRGEVRIYNAFVIAVL